MLENTQECGPLELTIPALGTHPSLGFLCVMFLSSLLPITYDYLDQVCSIEDSKSRNRGKKQDAGPLKTGLTALNVDGKNDRHKILLF